MRINQFQNQLKPVHGLYNPYFFRSYFLYLLSNNCNLFKHLPKGKQSMSLEMTKSAFWFKFNFEQVASASKLDKT